MARQSKKTKLPEGTEVLVTPIVAGDVEDGQQAPVLQPEPTPTPTPVEPKQEPVIVPNLKQTGVNWTWVIAGIMLVIVIGILVS